MRYRHFLPPLLFLLLSSTACFAQPIPDAHYPDMPLVLLKPEERTRLVNIARSELCPCDGVFTPLDDCLQRPEGTCRLAYRVGVLAMRHIKEGYSDSDVIDAIVREVETARKVFTFDLKQSPYRGTEKAKVIVVEFADFQCPHCALAAVKMKQVVEKYPDGIALYFKQFPLRTELGARATLAAHQQEKFWPMHDALMKNQGKITPEFIQQVATDLQLDLERFNRDLESEAIRNQVNADLESGERAGIDGTPTFFINGVRHEGSLEELESTIESLLKD